MRFTVGLKQRVYSTRLAAHLRQNTMQCRNQQMDGPGVGQQLPPGHGHQLPGHQGEADIPCADQLLQYPGNGHQLPGRQGEADVPRTDQQLCSSDGQLLCPGNDHQLPDEQGSRSVRASAPDCEQQLREARHHSCRKGQGMGRH